MNGLKNAETGIEGISPPDPKFVRVTELLRALQVAGALSLRVRADEANNRSTLIVIPVPDDEPALRDAAREVRQLLGLSADAREFTLSFGDRAANDRDLAVRSRSLLHILSGLSQRVEVPVEHDREGRTAPGLIVGQTDDAEGARYTRFRIHSGVDEPADAFVAIAYREQWFWIDDRDFSSKRAFSLIMLLFSLADSGVTQALPLVTIPAQ